MELVEFELAGGRYALPMERVVELAPAVRAHDLPGAPSVIEGLVNYRGAAIPVVSLRRAFALPERKTWEDHFVIAEGRARRYALRVDRAHGLLVVDTRTIASTAAVVPGPQGRHVGGVIVAPDGLVIVQDLDALLSLEEEQVVADALTAEAARSVDARAESSSS